MWTRWRRWSPRRDAVRRWCGAGSGARASIWGFVKGSALLVPDDGGFIAVAVARAFSYLFCTLI